jgi:hypothetical protein
MLQELKGLKPNSLNGMKNGIFPNQNGNRKNERKNSLPVFDTVTEDNLPVFVLKLKNTRSIRKRSEKTGNRNGTVRDFPVPFSSLPKTRAHVPDRLGRRRPHQASPSSAPR